MNDYFTKFIDTLSNMQHFKGNIIWTNEVNIAYREVMIVMTDLATNKRRARLVPCGYISTDDPEAQAKRLIESMYQEMESKTMMSVEEAIDQLEDLAGDVWSGARDGRAIYVSDDDYRALQVAIDALKEKLG